MEDKVENYKVEKSVQYCDNECDNSRCHECLWNECCYGTCEDLDRLKLRMMKSKPRD